MWHTVVWVCGVCVVRGVCVRVWDVCEGVAGVWRCGRCVRVWQVYVKVSACKRSVYACARVKRWKITYTWRAGTWYITTMILFTHYMQHTTHTHAVWGVNWQHTVCSTQLACILYALYNPHTCCMRCEPTAHCTYAVYNLHGYCMRYTTYMDTVCGIQPTCTLYAVYTHIHSTNTASYQVSYTRHVAGWNQLECSGSMQPYPGVL